MSEQTRKPTHRAYAVQKSRGGSHWTEIGALWPHKDGKGFNLKLDLLPLTGADISIRLIESSETNQDIAWDENGGAA